MNNLMIRRLLYAFKRQWGCELDYVQIVTSESDPRTGSRNITRRVIPTKAVRLPQMHVRKFIQDIGYLAANKNFTYGGLDDYNKATILLDRFELPADFQPELNGYIVLDHKRYERVSINDLFGEAYLLVAQGVEGANPYAEVRQTAFNTLQIQQRVSFELN